MVVVMRTETPLGLRPMANKEGRKTRHAQCKAVLRFMDGSRHGMAQSIPDEIDRPGLSADPRSALSWETAFVLHPLLAVMAIAMWDEVIVVMNGLIHSSAESLH